MYLEHQVTGCLHVWARCSACATVPAWLAVHCEGWQPLAEARHLACLPRSASWVLLNWGACCVMQGVR